MSDMQKQKASRAAQRNAAAIIVSVIVMGVIAIALSIVDPTANPVGLAEQYEPPVCYPAAGAGRVESGNRVAARERNDPPSDNNPAWNTGNGGNGISKEELVGNSVMANPLTVVELLRTALKDIASNPALYEALRDPSSQRFMQYMVECALAPNQEVVYGPTTWRGSLALCPDWHENNSDWHPHGHNSVISSRCQEIVSACLLARNNALGEKVSISMRGFRYPDDSKRYGNYFGSSPSDLKYTVREAAFFGNIFMPRGATEMPYTISVEDVDGVPDIRYHIGATSTSMRSFPDPMVPRGDKTAWERWKKLLETHGPMGEATIHLRTMYHRWVMEHHVSGAHPQDEPLYFYRDMFACWAPHWGSDGEPYTHKRLCGADGKNSDLCAAKPIGPCWPAAAESPGLCCQEHQPPTGHGDFDQCGRLPGTVCDKRWQYPITVFLCKPSDIVDMGGSQLATKETGCKSTADAGYTDTKSTKVARSEAEASSPASGLSAGANRAPVGAMDRQVDETVESP
ncbi:MAG: hypothetical protein MJE77_15880 [Proteobacteria bacterium]|nr:hypothetical protein [Pseudomonadota bacterium]